MNSIKRNGFSQKMAMAAATALVAATFSSFEALAGDVMTGSPDVNHVFGRASAIPTAGKQAKTGGLTVAVFGQASNSTGSPKLATLIGSREPDGLIAQYGRAAPRATIAQKAGATKTVTAKAR
jgi:hypothetical protein